MRKAEVVVGGVYVAKVSNRLTRVRIDGTHFRGGWRAKNLTTGCGCRIKSAARLREFVRMAA